MECQNHWFAYNERMSVESVAQAVSNLAIQFGDSDEDGGAMVSPLILIQFFFHQDLFIHTKNRFFNSKIMN